jgi:hypothetical protein
MFVKRRKEREPEVCIESSAESKKSRIFSVFSNKKRC